MTDDVPEIDFRTLERCFDGRIPSVMCTVSASGVPNITYVSKALVVDEQRVALSNQFLSKSARNLAENPYVDLLVADSETHDEYRLVLAYERTERRGPVFEQLKADVEAIAAIVGMQDVFRLHAADIYRVEATEAIRVLGPLASGGTGAGAPAADPAGLGELCARISRCADLDTLVRVVVDGTAELLGHHHCSLLLVDEDGKRLFTIASHGYEEQGVGSEVTVGEGLVGMAAAQCAPIRVTNLRQMAKYGQTVRRSFEEVDAIAPGREVPLPLLAMPQSRMAVPAMAMGQLVGVLAVEVESDAAYTELDASALQVVASLAASSIETIRAEERVAEARAAAPVAPPVPVAASEETHVRFFPVDGSTFLDGDYLIKGVAGRLLWSLAQQYVGEGRTEFTNREVRLDPTLDLPDFRDNFESRLILLKRRLDERGAPLRIEKTGRGRFSLVVSTALRLEEMGQPTPQ